MPYGTFNWNYAIWIGGDDEHDCWYDPVNDTYHIIQRHVEKKEDEDQ